MNVEASRESQVVGRQDGAAEDETKARPAYQPPRIVKKRAVSRATLFTGSGPTGGGIIGSDG